MFCRRCALSGHSRCARSCWRAPFSCVTITPPAGTISFDRHAKRVQVGRTEMEGVMAIVVKAYANADDVLIAWQPDPWPAAWVGFQLERRNDTNQQVTTLVNRIPPKAGQGPVQPTGIPSTQSPIRRCIWTDHSVVETDNVSYRVTAGEIAGDGAFSHHSNAVSLLCGATLAF